MLSWDVLDEALGGAVYIYGVQPVCFDSSRESCCSDKAPVDGCWRYTFSGSTLEHCIDL